MEKCKGSRDFLPQDMSRFRHVEKVFRSCCLAWGYQEVRTPTLEYLHLFTATGTLTPSRLNKVYSFLDWDGWSGERVVLRPEGTIPAVRLYMENLKEGSLNKLFYVGNIFSFEESGAESRERWQCGVESIGSANPTADAELILLAKEVLKRLGLGAVELRLSHVGLLRALLKESGLAQAEQNQALGRILDGDVQILEEALGANPQTRDSVPLLFELQGKSPGFLKNLKTSLTTALTGLESSLENFISVAGFLDTIENDYQIDIASSKGFEYYTGITFQFYLKGQRLGGGGRYDDLIPLLGGGSVPASGFAFDMDRLMGLLPEREGKTMPVRILVRNEEDSVEEWRLSATAADLLRKAGYVADLDSGYGESAEHAWILRTRGKTPRFLLEDQSGSKKAEASSIEEILEVLRKANEASSA